MSEATCTIDENGTPCGERITTQGVCYDHCIACPTCEEIISADEEKHAQPCDPRIGQCVGCLADLCTPGARTMSEATCTIDENGTPCGERITTQGVCYDHCVACPTCEEIISADEEKHAQPCDPRIGQCEECLASQSADASSKDVTP